MSRRLRAASLPSSAAPGRGEAFVPEMDGELEVLPEVVGKRLNLLGLCAFGTTHPERQPNDDFFDLVVTDDPVEKREVIFLVLAMEGLKPLGRNAERIGYGDTDAT